jgi:hypothetical protein
MSNGRGLNAERQRLENHRLGKENWRLWGPYLSERAWGTVREDYSAYGDAWDFLLRGSCGRGGRSGWRCAASL